MCLLGVIWSLGLWVRKAVECFKRCLEDCTIRSVEDSGAECDLTNYGWQPQEEKSNRGENLYHVVQNHPCDILVKIVAAFCPCPKILPDAKGKGFGFNLLAEKSQNSLI